MANELKNIEAQRGFNKTGTVTFVRQLIYSLKQGLIDGDGSSDFHSSKVVARIRFVNLFVSTSDWLGRYQYPTKITIRVIVQNYAISHFVAVDAEPEDRSM